MCSNRRFEIKTQTVDDRKYAAKCSNRMSSVSEYVDGAKFFTDVAAGSLSSIPRWRFAWVLEAQAEEAHSPRTGNALRAFLLPTCEISQGKNLLVAHIANRGSSCGLLRVTCLVPSIGPPHHPPTPPPPPPPLHK